MISDMNKLMNSSKRIVLIVVNLIPVIVEFILWAIGDMNYFFVFITLVLIVAIIDIVGSDEKNFFKLFGLLLGFSVVGTIILIVLHYYFVSSDFETPLVGALYVATVALEIIIMMGLGLVVKRIGKRKQNS